MAEAVVEAPPREAAVAPRAPDDAPTPALSRTRERRAVGIAIVVLARSQ